jgi:hypothetical protein
LEFYVYEKEGWQLRAKAQADPEFRGSSFFVAPMDAGVPGQVWFLTWRSTFGDTGARLRLRLYMFDGSVVKPLWKRDELIAGTVQVSPRAVVLEYDRKYRSADPLNRVAETWRVTPSGLR